MSKRVLRTCIAAFAALTLAGCDDATFVDTGTGGDDTTDPGAQVPTQISLLANTLTLPSSANTLANGVRLTAILKDSNSVIVPTSVVDFSTADTGINLTVTQATTDASGQALATLTIGTNANAQSNRTFTVTATSRSNPSVSDQLTITVTGTTLTVTGATTSQINATETYTVLLKDSEGTGLGNKTITVQSSSGNALSDSSLTTDAAGRATVDVTFSSGLPTDTLTFAGIGETQTLDVAVTTDAFAFTTPAADTEISLNTNQAVTVCWTRASANVNGAALTFSATRGTFVGGVNTATTASGCGTVSIRSASAGFTTVQVTGVDTTPDPDITLTATRRFEFVATTPATIDVQSNPTIIGTGEQSTIAATVRDASANLVKNAVVRFEIVADTTNGDLSSSESTTDSQGNAEVVYTASSTTSSSNGIRIRGGIDTDADGDLDITDETTLTVGGEALRISLGTDNEITEPGGDTVYEKQYTVTVTDSAGRPKPDATVSLSIHAMSYDKGCSEFNGTVWVRTDCNGGPPISCSNEDLIGSDDANDLNGILDAGEDIDGDNSLDPENAAAVVDEDDNPSLTELDADGRALFKIRYTEDRADWVSVRLRATALVGGSEGVAETFFSLTGAAADFQNESIAPPGAFSPYGIQQDCTREPLIAFTSSGRTVLEGDSGSQTITIPVRMSLPLPTNSVTVPFTVAELDGATAGADFSCSTPSPLTIAASATPATVNITCAVPGDIVKHEGLDGFRITLGEPNQFALTDPDNNTFTVVITDNDKGVIVTESDGTTEVDEDGADDTYTIVLTAAPTADVTINLTTTDLTQQLLVSANTLTFTTTNWDTPQTVVVSAIDDADVEGDHIATIDHQTSSADGDYNALNSTQIPGITVFISDNDTAP